MTLIINLLSNPLLAHSLQQYIIPDGTPMVVVKCPTYYAGDIRRLTQRNIPELQHLVDVVVFPVEGLERPHPHEIHERYNLIKCSVLCLGKKYVLKKIVD